MRDVHRRTPTNRQTVPTSPSGETKTPRCLLCNQTNKERHAVLGVFGKDAERTLHAEMRANLVCVAVAVCCASVEAALRDHPSNVALLSPQPELSGISGSSSFARPSSLRRNSREKIASLWQLAKYVSFFAVLFLLAKCYPLVASSFKGKTLTRRLAEAGGRPCQGGPTPSAATRKGKKTYAEMSEQERQWLSRFLQLKAQRTQGSSAVVMSEWVITYPSEFVEVYTREHKDEQGNKTGKVSRRILDYQNDTETIRVEENGEIVTEKTSAMGGVLVPQLSSQAPPASPPAKEGGEATGAKETEEAEEASGEEAAASSSSSSVPEFPVGTRLVRESAFVHPTTGSSGTLLEGVNPTTGEKITLWRMVGEEQRRTVLLQLRAVPKKSVLKTSAVDLASGDKFSLSVINLEAKHVVQAVVEDSSSRSITDIVSLGEGVRTYHEADVSKSSGAVVTVFETIRGDGSIVGETLLSPSEVQAMGEKLKQIDLRVQQLEEEVKYLAGLVQREEGGTE